MMTYLGMMISSASFKLNLIWFIGQWGQRTPKTHVKTNLIEYQGVT